MRNRSLPSVMNHSFSQVPSVSIQRSSFDRSHGYKTTFEAGDLVPFYVDEALPGDTFSLRASVFARIATLQRPLMDNMYCDTFFFAVPLRLLQDNFVRLMGEQDDPEDSIDFLTPITTSPAGTGFVVGSLYDYFGVPTGVAGLPVVNYHARAYNLIWNYWFRDQNLQDSVVVDKDDGPDAPTDYVLLKRGKRHDYFTSSLPWPSKGPDVTIPLGTQAPVTGIGLGDTPGAASSTVYRETGGVAGTWPAGWTSIAPTAIKIEQDPLHVGYPAIFADLSQATAATINTLREAVTFQQYYEVDARGGTRYPEKIRAHFGVRNPDARMQWPEYLGGGSTPVTINPISQNTPASGGSTPLGTLGGVGSISVTGHGFTKSFTENCVVIGLVNVRADLNYQYGLHRMFSRRAATDFFWPTFANLGEQAVLNKEIYAVGTATPGQDDQAFGYQERYAEYRYKPSLITGQFRSSFAQSLDIWHLAEEFTALPVLNDEFITDEPPLDRVIAVPSEPHFIFDSFVNLKCARPMPVYSVPGLKRF